MTHITMENFEAYCLDYYEGNLASDEVIALMSFLDLYPEAKEQFDNFEAVYLEADESIHFSIKEQLHKPEVISVGSIDESNYQEYFVRSIDNELSNQEQELSNLFVQKNPTLKRELDLFKATVSQADFSITYPNKEELKRKVVPMFGRKTLLTVVSIAAMVAFAVLVINPFESGLKHRAEQLAYSNSISDIQLKSSNKTEVPINIRKVESFSVGIILEEQTEETIRINAISLVKPRINDLQLAANVSPVKEYIPMRMDLIHAYEFAMLRDMLEFREEQEHFNEKSTLGKGMYALTKMVTGKKPGNIGVPQNISLWSLADFSVAQLSFFTNSDMDIHRKDENNERVVTFSYNSKNVNIERRRKLRR